MQHNDLYQQRRMAEAAETMNGLTFVQTRALVGQTIIVLFALLAAIAAARYAKDAARHAEAGVFETRRIGETQSRAYLSVIRADIHIGRGGEIIPDLLIIDLRLYFHNSGQTPALNVSYYCTSCVLKWRKINTVPLISTVPSQEFVNNIPPSQTNQIKAISFGIARHLRKMIALWKEFTSETPIGDAPILMIYGVVFYEDVFGDTFRSQFNFWLEEQPTQGRPLRGKDDLPTIQARVPTFERIGDRQNYVMPETPDA